MAYSMNGFSRQVNSRRSRAYTNARNIGISSSIDKGAYILAGGNKERYVVSTPIGIDTINEAIAISEVAWIGAITCW
jgi:hypothetical protein